MNLNEFFKPTSTEKLLPFGTTLGHGGARILAKTWEPTTPATRTGRAHLVSLKTGESWSEGLSVDICTKGLTHAQAKNLCGSIMPLSSVKMTQNGMEITVEAFFANPTERLLPWGARVEIKDIFYTLAFAVPSLGDKRGGVIANFYGDDGEAWNANMFVPDVGNERVKGLTKEQVRCLVNAVSWEDVRIEYVPTLK